MVLTGRNISNNGIIFCGLRSKIRSWLPSQLLSSSFLNVKNILHGGMGNAAVFNAFHRRKWLTIHHQDECKSRSSRSPARDAQPIDRPRSLQTQARLQPLELSHAGCKRRDAGCGHGNTQCVHIPVSISQLGVLTHCLVKASGFIGIEHPKCPPGCGFVWVRIHSVIVGCAPFPMLGVVGFLPYPAEF